MFQTLIFPSFKKSPYMYSYWKQHGGPWSVISMLSRMEFWDPWALEGIGQVTRVSSYSGFTFRAMDCGILSRPQATVIILGISGSIRKQRLFKGIQVEVGRLGQLLPYFQEAVTLVFFFCSLDMLSINETFPPRENSFNPIVSTIMVTCYLHLWHHF